MSGTRARPVPAGACRAPAAGFPTSRTWLLMLLVTLCLPLAPAKVAAQLPHSTAEEARGFEVLDASVRLQDGIYVLDADVLFRLSASAREALSSGVPLNLYVDVRVMRSRFVLDKEVFRTSVILRVETHPLSQQLVVTDSRSGSSETYASYGAMLEGIRHVRGIRLLAPNALAEGESHYAMVRASLDIEALPLPLRPLAWISPDWAHTSDWTEVPL
ncbi:MAG: DUF4390 domain-containing protein [Gammaproteobacteria bacterium]|nr:DUF4390 domain-containing protein [Gammaproteobacteria bacterium]